MAARRDTRSGSIYALPKDGVSYNKSLYSAAEGLGVHIKDAVWSGRWLLAHLRPGDVLHLHWPSFLYYSPKSRLRSFVALLRFVIICLMLRARGLRFFWTAHNLYPHDGGKGEWMHRFGRRFVVGLSETIFVHGPNAAAIVRSEFPAASGAIRVIVHGHWIDAYPNSGSRSEARRRLGLQDDSHVFLFIGLCKPYKGLEALIDAFSVTPAGAVLLIAGRFQSESYRAAIAARAERLGRGRISVRPGFIQEQELQWFLNAADTVVLPYQEILTSGAAMLAMSFGKPVVAPRLGALVDLVDASSGILYDPYDSTALRHALAAARSRAFEATSILKHASTFTWADAARALIAAADDSGRHRASDRASGVGPGAPSADHGSRKHRHSYGRTIALAFAGAVASVSASILVAPAAGAPPLAWLATAVASLAALLLTAVFLGGLVVVRRDTCDRRAQPDLFYRYFSRVPTLSSRGVRRWIRPLLGRALRPGDIVRVRPHAEIAETLDDSGRLDGLPFMPEMLAYNGREMIVDRRIDKINDWMGGNQLRRTKQLVTLVDVRCAGTAHGGCQAACQILWHRRWLTRIPGPRPQPSDPHSMRWLQALDRLLLMSASRQYEESGRRCTKYMCQLTELLRASEPMSRWDLRQDLRPLFNGTLPLAGWLVAMLTAVFNKVQAMRGGSAYPATAPQLASGPTPTEKLDLLPGELVRVRDKREISLTLYRNHNRGMWFGRETLRFCNRVYRVRSRVERIINERTGEMIRLHTPGVILEAVCGSGEFLRFCPQNEFVFWREIWLRRLTVAHEPPDAPAIP